MANVVKGTVYDAGGEPKDGYIVRAYRRDTGALLGEAVTADGVNVAGDDYYNNVLLTLHGNGANNSTSFPDTGPSARTVTRLGDTKVDTGQSKYGGASIYFDGSGDYLTVPSSSDWNVSSTDVTVELWIRPTGSAGLCLIDSRNSSTGVGWQFFLWTDNSIFVQGSSGSVISSAGVITRSTWAHIAWSKSGITSRLFVNGILVATSTTMTISSFTDALYIGRTRDAAYQYVGHMDDIRITKGVARYTANFTPPAAQFLDVEEVVSLPLGEYAIDTGSFTDEVQIICLDDAGGTLENDRIHRAYPVTV